MYMAHLYCTLTPLSTPMCFGGPRAFGLKRFSSHSLVLLETCFFVILVKSSILVV